MTLYWHRTDYLSYPSDYKLVDENSVLAATDGYYDYDEDDNDASYYTVTVLTQQASPLYNALPGKELLTHLESISEAFGVSMAELHEVWQDNE